MPRGSKPGERRGGRGKGTANKRTREIANKAAAEGLTPLEYMIAVMRDEAAEPDRRADMAKAAAPYMHPRLQMIQGDPAKPLLAAQKINVLVLARQIALSLRIARALLGSNREEAEPADVRASTGP